MDWKAIREDGGVSASTLSTIHRFFLVDGGLGAFIILYALVVGLRKDRPANPFARFDWEIAPIEGWIGVGMLISGAVGYFVTWLI